ncbi:unnamed protein product [Sphagnum balticum]
MTAPEVGNFRSMGFTTVNHCPPPAFKLITVVDPGTCSLKRNLSACWSAEFQKDFCHDYYIAPTTAVEVHTLHFLTNSGRRIQFDCWHTNSGQESPRGLRDGYFIGAHCAMIIIDLNARLTDKYLRKLYHDLLKVCEDIPVVLCGINNMDMNNREVKVKQVTFQRGRPLPYYEISAESNYNFEKPFRYLARELVGDANLHFEKSPAALAEVQVDIATTREHHERQKLE